MIKKPKTEMSTFTLYKYAYACDATTGELLDSKLINKQIMLMLEDSKKCQQEMLDNCVKNDIHFSDTGFHTTNARALIKYGTMPNYYKRNYKMREVNASEAYRLFQVFEQRKAIAQYLKDNNWELSEKDIANYFIKLNGEDIDKDSSQYIDFNLIKNIKNSHKIPDRPKIKSVMFPLSAASNDLLTYEVTDNFSKVILKDFHLADNIINIVFDIPKHFIDKYKNIYKITKPTIRFDRRKHSLAFDFVIKEKCDYTRFSGKFLSIDLGVVMPACFIKYDAKNRLFSRPYSISNETFSVFRNIWALEKQRSLLFNRISELKRVQSGSLDKVIRELDFVKSKISALRRNACWEIARDAAVLCDDGDVCVHEYLKWIDTSRRWRSSAVDDIDHVCHRDGIVTIAGRTAYSSQTCPVCGEVHEADDDRFFRCSSCGLVLDRDVLSCVNQCVWAADGIGEDASYLRFHRGVGADRMGCVYSLGDVIGLSPVVGWSRSDFC